MYESSAWIQILKKATENTNTDSGSTTCTATHKQRAFAPKMLICTLDFRYGPFWMYLETLVNENKTKITIVVWIWWYCYVVSDGVSEYGCVRLTLTFDEWSTQPMLIKGDNYTHILASLTLKIRFGDGSIDKVPWRFFSVKSCSKT